MPTITQLPSVATVTAADALPISQNGVAHSVSVGSLLASTQPAIISDSGTLLGRTSLGPGGPEPISVGSGLLMNAGTLSATAFDPESLPQHNTISPTDDALLNSNGSLTLLPLTSLRNLFSAGTNISIDTNGTISASAIGGGSYSVTSLTPVATIASNDLVAISQGGTDHSISYANLLDGLTIDAASAAAPVSDTDAFWVGQGSSTMFAQTFADVWKWIQIKLPAFRRPVVEITVNTTLDGSVHNTAILVCSQPVTLTPAFINMGSGFNCGVINVSTGSVSFGSGIITSSGSQTLPSGQAAELQVFTYSGGNVVFAAIAGAAQVQPPGQVTGLAVGVTTPSSVALTWQAPGTGGAATGYTVNYRVTAVGGGWTSQSATATSLTVTGLAAATQYDFEVIANNAGGSGAASSVVTGTTLAAPTQAPGQVTGLTAGAATASTVNLSWSAPGTGGAVSNYTIQYRVTGGTGWNTAASGINSTSYQVAGLSPTTAYDFQVFGVNQAGAGSPSAIASATTTIAGPGMPAGLVAGTVTTSSVPLSWTAPMSGGAPASYLVRWSPHNANAWTQSSPVSNTSFTVTGLTANTSYDFEVQAVNAAGSSAWTAPTTVTTPGNYLLSNINHNPADGSTFAINQSGIVAQISDNSASIDGNYTVPASVAFYWSTSNTVVPTTGAQSGVQWTNAGHNLWVQYISAPGTAGNYYLWAVAKDSVGNVVAFYVWPSAFTVHA